MDASDPKGAAEPGRRPRAHEGLGRVTEDIAAIAQEIVDAAAREARRGCVTLLVVDEDRRVLRHLAWSDPDFRAAPVLLLDGPGISVAAAVSGHTQNVPDVTRDPRHIAIPYTTGSELAVPLKVGDRVIAILDFEAPEPGAFGEADVSRLEAFSSRAAIALENARLHERLRERTRQLERLHELSLMMLGDPAEIYRAIARQMAELVRAPYASIVRIEGDLIRSLAIVSPGDDREGATCPIAVTPCRVVRDTRRPYVARDVRRRFPDDPYLQARDIRTFVGAPVLDRRGEVVAVLDSMDRRSRDFGEDDLRILNLLARRVSEEMEDERRESERRATQERLVQSEKMASLGQVVAGVAHELNNPLASVLGLTELLLRRDDLPAPAQEALRTVAGEAERARRVVRSLLAFAREHEPERAATSLRDVVDRTLALREPQLRLSNIELVRELAEDLPPTLADAHLLQQALLNLVLNAERAMREAHGRGRLTLRARFRADGGERVAGPALRVEVEDDGPGISGADLRRVFEPFYTTRPVGQGTGLGLSLTHSIVEQHGGAVWAERAEGGGARLVVELPHVPPAAAAPAPQAPTAASSLSGRRVLLVEDEAPLREIAREVLEAEGCRVEEAASGREALSRIAAAEFDLVVSDVRMPGLGGFDLYREARTLRPALAQRFLFVTGDVVSDDTARFFEQTGSAHLEKPYNVEQLLKKVKEVLAAPLA